MTPSPIRTPAVGTLSLVAVIVWAIAGYVASAVGQDALPTAPPFSDYRSEKPGVMHRITVADLPKPFATEASNNGPKVVPRPEGAVPQALPGYTVTLYAEGLENPRLMRTAPNGDLFVAETGPGRIRVLRGHDAVRQATGDGGLRRRLEPSLRHRVLPGRPEPAVRLRRQHRLDRPLPVSGRAT